MNSNANLATDNLDATASAVDIDTLDVSDKWKKYFKAIHKHGGLQAPLFKALPKDQRKAALKEMQPPVVSFATAFVFGFLY